MSKRKGIPCSNNLRDRRAVNHALPPLEQIVRLLARQTAREALAGSDRDEGEQYEG